MALGFLPAFAGQELSLEEHHKRQVAVQTQFAPRKYTDIFGYVVGQFVL